jgi:hypothetical protein
LSSGIREQVDRIRHAPLDSLVAFEYDSGMGFSSRGAAWLIGVERNAPLGAAPQQGATADQDRAFARKGIGLTGSLAGPAHGGLVFRQAEPRGHLFELIKNAAFEPPDLPSLQLRVDAPSLISVTGASTASYSFSAAAEHPTEPVDEDVNLPQLIQLMRDNQCVLLTAPRGLTDRGYMCYLDVVGPADKPVLIDASWAAVDVSGIVAPVRISSNHGRVSVLETCNDVYVTATQGGYIVWSGSRGIVELDADLGIDLKLTQQHYDGVVKASADGKLRVQLPRGFASSIAVQVTSDDQLRCDGDLKRQFDCAQGVGHVILSCGSGSPTLQLASRGEIVIIED